MSNNCSLCKAELTSMDTLLGENKLADGGVLCNKCLDKISYINQELLYNLNKFSIDDINSMIENKKEEQNQPVVVEENLPMAADSEPQSISREVFKRRKQKIKNELENLNVNLSVFTKGEIKELPNLISEDEKIIAVTDAQFVKTLDAGILVATQKRMLSVSKSMFGAAKIIDYPNDAIKSVSFVTDPRSPIIKLHLDERVIEFECYLDREDAEKFYDTIKGIYNQPQESQTQPVEKPKKQTQPVKTLSTEEVFEQLEKLGRLRENGVLTDVEFAEQKKKLLEQLQ
ncbi:Short C-terminal domain-containing protein [Chryseobacterium joostei]|uniref:Short C-terminal domain-containing protein n=1 Tax=Chryseobacterium joostei TaxID=112234 RepID=A0A1N7HWD7_9FLAO|nr:PH domain-containing protein [Chryseobacterium joostei]SIS29136.1 Short C-terminal domain-containing protein [Chryseobacterium joostei]